MFPLMSLETYFSHRTNVYPSPESLRWFIRQNRAQLAAAGALSMPTGRLLIDPAAFDAVVLKIGAQRARGELVG